MRFSQNCFLSQQQQRIFCFTVNFFYSFCIFFVRSRVWFHKSLQIYQRTNCSIVYSMLSDALNYFIIKSEILANVHIIWNCSHNQSHCLRLVVFCLLFFWWVIHYKCPSVHFSNQIDLSSVLFLTICVNSFRQTQKNLAINVVMWFHESFIWIMTRLSVQNNDSESILIRIHMKIVWIVVYCTLPVNLI